MIRAIINAVSGGVRAIFSASGRAGETFESREYLQHYGYASRPLSGAEAILIKEGNHIMMIASDDRRYRLALEEGEVAIYTDEGDKIHFQRGKTIEVTTDTYVVHAKTATTNAEIINLNGSQKISMTTPHLAINAASISATGAGGVAAMDFNGKIAVTDDVTAGQISLKTHTHSGVQTGQYNTGQPNK